MVAEGNKKEATNKVQRDARAENPLFSDPSVPILIHGRPGPGLASPGTAWRSVLRLRIRPVSQVVYYLRNPHVEYTAAAQAGA